MGSPVIAEAVTPRVSWIETPAVDVVTALNSLQNIPEGLWTVSRTAGESVDTYLRWARTAIDSADSATAEDVQKRHMVEAVGHAKRALDRLFDEFLRRDCLHVQLHARPSFSDRLELLRRRLGNRVPWRLIPAVVADPRNDAEHEYDTPTLDEAGRAVEAAEVIANAMRISRHPLLRPTLLGRVAVSITSTNPLRTTFHGFDHHSRGLAVCAQGRDEIVRIAAGRVISLESVELVWCRLDSLSVAQHLKLLDWWDAQCTKIWIEAHGAEATLRAARLEGPP